jgi:undecaprenyl phosphate N,N'-diacetylbacillosamine 1-phosphate transferase
MNLKRIFYLFLSALLFPILIFPIFLICILVVIIDRNLPFFFQDRIGFDGKVFKLIKFRTMTSSDQIFNMTEKAGLVLGDDDRVTKLGFILRKFSLDELPQIINVIQGVMSFVGPRAAMVGEMEEQNFNQALIKKRCSIKPGITGLAQVNGRNRLSWKEKMYLDIEYVEIQNKGFNLCKDIKILFQTLMIVILANDVVEQYGRDGRK